MSVLKVGVLSKIPNLLSELKLKLPLVKLLETDSSSTSLKQVDVLVADFDLLGPHLYDLDHIKFVQGTWAGIDALIPHLKPESKQTLPILRFSGEHFGRIISEYVIAAIVNHERDVFKVYKNQQRMKWSQPGKIHDYRTVYDLKIGVLGVGNIGSRLLSTLKHFGAHTRALGRRETLDLHEFTFVDEYFPIDKLQEFLISCDYFVNTLPSTRETKGVLNNNVLEVCKDKKPVFVNVGRGSVISDESLINALQNDWLSHAYLDVFNEEPLPESSLLWQSEKVTVTPHVAATSRGKDIAQQFSDNLTLFLGNKPLPTEIDFSRGY